MSTQSILVNNDIRCILDRKISDVAYNSKLYDKYKVGCEIDINNLSQLNILSKIANRVHCTFSQEEMFFLTQKVIKS